jgi:TRAP-type C4-dicarboxylate transport system substrate-binding protein
MSPGVLLVSKRTWNTLSADDQAIFRAAAKESVAFNRKLWDDIERAMPQAAAAMKVEIVSDVEEASFAEAIASARGRQLTSPRAAELAERIAAAP